VLEASLIPASVWAKIRFVITGYNTDIKHNDRVFHVQTEDKGVDNPVIESLIYMGGKIVASRQYSYGPLLREGYSEKAVQDLLDAQHRKMMRDIQGGKYDPDGPPPFGAGLISDRSFDELVLEFVRSQAGSESLELVLAEARPVRAGELVVLELLARSEVRNTPVAGARIVIRASATDEGRGVSVFEGATDEAGRLKAGFEVPRDFAGGRVVIEASGAIGADELALPIGEGGGA